MHIMRLSLSPYRTYIFQIICNLRKHSTKAHLDCFQQFLHEKNFRLNTTPTPPAGALNRNQNQWEHQPKLCYEYGSFGSFYGFQYYRFLTNAQSIFNDKTEVK